MYQSAAWAPVPGESRPLTIEHPFGSLRPKEVPVTKHDAERKRRILEFIAATTRETGFPPSIRDIARAVDLASTSAVHHHLQALERDGYLERVYLDGPDAAHRAAQPRALRLTPAMSSTPAGESSRWSSSSTRARGRVSVGARSLWRAVTGP